MNVREIPCKNIRNYISDPWVDQTRKPYVKDDIAYIPVKEGYPYTRTLLERKRKGRGYQKIGPIIAFHGVKPDPDNIDEVVREHDPQAVIWYRGHHGDMRIPDIAVLWGVVSDVLHHESGIKYHLNPGRVMFSQGNREEKMRVAGLIKPGERVCDMFAGIGYFSLPLAKAGAYVHAIEINPESVHYLAMNVRENNLDSRVSVIHGDCRDHLSGIYDRIHMGYYEAARFLSCALDHVQSGSILHVHGIGDNTGVIRQIMSESQVDGMLSHRIVKKIGPGKVHTVTDVVLS